MVEYVGADLSGVVRVVCFDSICSAHVVSFVSVGTDIGFIWFEFVAPTDVTLCEGKQKKIMRIYFSVVYYLCSDRFAMTAHRHGLVWNFF